MVKLYPGAVDISAEMWSVPGHVFLTWTLSKQIICYVELGFLEAC